MILTYYLLIWLLTWPFNSRSSISGEPDFVLETIRHNDLALAIYKHDIKSELLCNGQALFRPEYEQLGKAIRSCIIFSYYCDASALTRRITSLRVKKMMISHAVLFEISNVIA